MKEAAISSQERVDMYKSSSGLGTRPLVILWYPSGVKGSSIPSILDEMFADDAKRVVESLQEATAALEANPNASLFVACEAAVPTLCAALEQNQNPDSVLDDWQKTSQDLLEVSRRFRRRTTILLADLLLSNPMNCARAVSRPLKSNKAWDNHGSDHTVADPVIKLIAYEILRRHVVARRLAGELEASAVDLSDGSAPHDADPLEASKHYRKEKETIATLSDIRRSETDTILKQLHAAQEQILQLVNHNDQLNEGIQEIEAQLIETTASRDELTERLAKRDSAISEKNLKLQKLSARKKAITSERNTLRSRIQDIKSEQDKLTKELDNLSAYITEVHKSRSYRIMAPLRKIRAAAKRKG